MTGEIDSWLTAVRLRRLPEVLAAIRTHPPPGIPEQRAHRVVWSRCNGPLDDVQGLIDVLLACGLLERRGSLMRLTTRGRRVATQDHQHGGRLLARSLIDAGCFRNQARRLLASSDFSDCGDLACKRAAAVEAAAQLTGALRRWQQVTLDSHLRVPADLVTELLASWSLQPVPRSSDEEIRSEVGDRAEAYSYRWEQENSGDPSRIHWVALDDDSLGYDIRNAGASPEKFIEVKGSQGRAVRFFLSSNEWGVGHELGDAYEVHFWGGISLARPRPEEYLSLRSAGYPLVFRNLAAHLVSGNLLAAPSQYLVVAEAPADPVSHPSTPREGATRMDHFHPAEVARALVLYEHEVGAKQRAEALFAGHESNYVEDWTERLAGGICEALAQMDQATTERYVNQALGSCGERVRAWWSGR